MYQQKVFNRLAGVEKYWFFCCLLCFVSVALDGQNQVLSLSLEEAIEYADMNNLTAKTSETELEISKEKLKEIRANGMPQISAGLNYQYFLQVPTSILPGALNPEQQLLEVVTIVDEVGTQGTQMAGFPKLDAAGNIIPGAPVPAQFGTKNNLTGELSASQLLFSGSYLVALEAAKESNNYYEGNVEQAKRDVRLQVAQAYYQALIAQEQIKLLKKNKENLEKVFFETEQLNKNGFVEEIDVDRLRLTLSNLNTQINTAQRGGELTEAALKFQLGLNADTPIELSDSIEGVFKDLDPNILVDGFSPTDRIEYRILETQSKLVELDVKSTRWSKYPTVSAFGSYQQAFQNDDFGKVFNGSNWFPTFVVGLNVSVPIYSGGRLDAQIRQKELQGLQIQTGKELLTQSFNLEIEQAKIAYTNSLEQMQSQKSNLELAQKIYDVTLIKYNEGFGSSLEVNSAETELFQTQGLYIQSLYDLIVAKLNLDKAIGEI